MFCIISAFVFCNTFANAQQDNVNDIIDKVLEAYGGQKKLTKVTAYYMEGTIYSTMRKKESPTTRTFSRPDRLKVVLKYPGEPEIRILDVNKGWRTGQSGELSSVDGFQLDAMVLQAGRANLPWILDEKREKIKLVEPLEKEGKELIGLEITIDKGLMLRVYIQPDSNLIIKSIALLDHPKMKTHFETVYADFKKVKGVLFPFKEENYASGYHTGSTTISKIKINPKISEKEFQP